MENAAVKDAFVRDVLNSHGQYVTTILNNSISELTLIQQGGLKGSVSYDVKKEGNDYVLAFNFMSYGRAIEIAYFRRKKGREIEKQLYGIKSREDVKAEMSIRNRKNTRWYSRNVYGTINTLYGRLMHGFTEEEAERLKNIIAEAVVSSSNSSIVIS